MRTHSFDRFRICILTLINFHFSALIYTFPRKAPLAMSACGQPFTSHQKPDDDVTWSRKRTKDRINLYCALCAFFSIIDGPPGGVWGRCGGLLPDGMTRPIYFDTFESERERETCIEMLKSKGSCFRVKRKQPQNYSKRSDGKMTA